MGFKARMDSSSPALFCHLHTTDPRVTYGCRDQESNLESLIPEARMISLNDPGLAPTKQFVTITNSQRKLIILKIFQNLKASIFLDGLFKS